MESLRPDEATLPHPALQNNLYTQPIEAPAQHFSYPTGNLFMHGVADGGFEYDSPDYYATVAKTYVESVFPHVKLNLLSSIGSSAILLEDKEHNLAFKVRRDASRYTYFENEMGALTLLNKVDLAPKPYLLLDAAMNFRTEEPHGLVRREFGEVPIIRQEGYGRFPVIVMDRIDYQPLKTMLRQQAVAEFVRVARIAATLGLQFGDCELVHDTKTGKAQIIDAAGIGWVDKELYENTEYAYTAKATHRKQFKSIESLVSLFFARDTGIGIPYKSDHLKTLFTSKGLEGVAKMIYMNWKH